MNEWFAPVCQLLTPGVESGLSLLCAALVVLLLAVIALGFGPLRAWLSPATGHPASSGQAADCDSGLVSTWRLYRQLGRAPRHR